MNPYTVCLYSDGTGACWVQVVNAGIQEGSNIDCDTRRKGRAVARRECKRLYLKSFSEHQTHAIRNNKEAGQ